MLRSQAHRLRALAVAALLAVPLLSAAQAPPTPAAAVVEKPAKPAPPTTAPIRNVPDNPARGMPAEQSTATGSTAIPGWNHPPASWDNWSEQPQYASIPGRETNVLIQDAGREWRELHNGPMTQYGGWLLVVVLALMALFYLVRGTIRLHGQPTGRLIERFNALERTAHWTLAIAFVLLAFTGLVMFFGKHLILPWLGYAGFSWLTTFSKNVHNFVGPLFIFALVVMFLIFVKDNLLSKIDIEWFTKLGGMLSKKGEMPSGRFNGGEKAWFWGGMVVLGVLVSVTGLVLDFPNWNQGREIMQGANVVHAIAALIFIAASFGHIYLGTIGMAGTYRAM
ncbi:MAG TPA: formate dehydrogenase subunit gamma, partial [Usitatibacter sp.]|nr:formate dehydrogenase subunit gamma [Usitatibacter sp.]